MPTWVRIGPQCYTILRRRFEKKRRYHVGHIEYRKNRIQIADDVPSSRQREALLHEILHATCSATGINERLDADEAEYVVTALAPALLAVLRENPHVVAYLTSE